MADKLAKIRDFLWQEARRRPRKFLKGPLKVPNGKALSKEMGINQSTVSRILHPPPGGARDSGPGAVEEFTPKAQLIRGLKKLSGIESDSELWEAIENASQAPPVESDPKKP
jgi:hypothetical protein